MALFYSSPLPTYCISDAPRKSTRDGLFLHQDAASFLTYAVLAHGSYMLLKVTLELLL